MEHDAADDAAGIEHIVIIFSPVVSAQAVCGFEKERQVSNTIRNTKAIVATASPSQINVVLNLPYASNQTVKPNGKILRLSLTQLKGPKRLPQVSISRSDNIADVVG